MFYKDPRFFKKCNNLRLNNIHNEIKNDSVFIEEKLQNKQIREKTVVVLDYFI